MARSNAVRGRAARRKTHWVSVSGAASLSVTGPFLLFTAAIGHEGETIVRVRGLLEVLLTAATAAGDGFSGAFGIAIVTTAAATAGVGSIPTPVTEAGWDGWLLHRFLGIHRTMEVGGPGPHMLLELDSKAMRKANEDESLVGVLDVIEDGTAVMDVIVQARVLSMIG